MAEPIVFISHSRFKPGAFDMYRELSREVTPLIERDKPGTVVFLPAFARAAMGPGARAFVRRPRRDRRRDRGVRHVAGRW